MITHNEFQQYVSLLIIMMSCQIKLRKVLHKKQAKSYYFKNKAILQSKVPYIYYFLCFLTIHWKCETRQGMSLCWRLTQNCAAFSCAGNSQSPSPTNIHCKWQGGPIISCQTKASLHSWNAAGLHILWLSPGMSEGSLDLAESSSHLHSLLVSYLFCWTNIH